jgi:hypothetical protein
MRTPPNGEGSKILPQAGPNADNVATHASDPELEAEFRVLARAYRSQAAVAKRNKAKQKPTKAKPKKGVDAEAA